VLPHRAARPFCGARGQAARRRAQAAEGSLHSAERTDRAQGRAGRRSLFHRVRHVDVIFSDRRIPLGSGDFFGEMALITGEPRQADVRAQTYTRLLVLRKSDFDRFMRDNRDVRLKIREVAERRLLENRPEAAAAT
jgi:CRP-like cAMP-binding protein